MINVDTCTFRICSVGEDVKILSQKCLNTLFHMKIIILIECPTVLITARVEQHSVVGLLSQTIILFNKKTPSIK